MGEGFVVTDHAARRYVERVKPGLDVDQARVEVARLAGMGSRLPNPPVWKPVSKTHGPCEWVEPSDGVAFALDGNRVLTVVVRGGQGDSYAVERRQERRRRRLARRTKAQVAKHGHGRGRPVYERDDWKYERDDWKGEF